MEFESPLAEGLRNVLAHGNSTLRKSAADALAKLQCLDRSHAGDGGVCRITCGASVNLGDCPCQAIAIGPLQFCAIDYGDSINLSEKLQQRLTSIDREERDQCTLLATDAGIIDMSLKPRDIPARSRVSLREGQLRANEWLTSHPLHVPNVPPSHLARKWA